MHQHTRCAHLCEDVHRIAREGEVRRAQQSQGVELMPKRPLGDRELSGVGPVEAVHAVHSEYTLLQQGRSAVWAVTAISARSGAGKLQKITSDRCALDRRGRSWSPGDSPRTHLRAHPSRLDAHYSSNQRRSRLNVSHGGRTLSYLPLCSLSHIPCDVPHLLPLREELVQIRHALSILRQKLRLARDRLPRLDQVEDEDGSSISA